jgi:hypothetical protein
MFPMRRSNYDKAPAVDVSPLADQCWRGWEAVIRQLRQGVKGLSATRVRAVVAVECYTGVHEDEVLGQLTRGLPGWQVVKASSALKPPDAIDRMVAPYLGGDDPIFGYYSGLKLREFFDEDRRGELRNQVARAAGPVLVYGTGATLCCDPDVIVYADMPRWEGQLRQRRNEVSNLGVSNAELKASLQYKRSFFVDWRVCDRHKKETIGRWDYLLDTTAPGDPKMIAGDALRAALDDVVRRPFRVVPFFDPAPWGGQWMKNVCDLDRSAPNFGWCFDCVPEENSLLLKFGQTTVEIPSTDLLFYRPEELLGPTVYGTFGPEFPIRFDFLDTFGGGNLSLQVHPTIGYAQEEFGLRYTQDESYYLLDAGEDACVYLGMKTGADPREMFEALAAAQREGGAFPAERFVNRWPARKHDHFLIPAGTIHCSGADAMVLEISATPYIFTFKLWDWGRLGLDGLPRPINLERGRAVLRPERDTAWAREQLINAVEPLGGGPGWREERTGLHRLEFIETRRHWFTGTVAHDTQGRVNVLNLVEGDEVVVESPTGMFEPFVVHYAETFIVPAAVGGYTIRPLRVGVGGECATVKAFPRVSAGASLIGATVAAR